MYALQDLGWTDSHRPNSSPTPATASFRRVAARHRGAYVLFSELGELRAETSGRLAHARPGPATCPRWETGS